MKTEPNTHITFHGSTPEEIFNRVRLCARQNNVSYTFMLDKLDMKIFLAKFGITPHLLYTALKENPDAWQGSKKFARRELKF
jgi:hypothetical protein